MDPEVLQTFWGIIASGSFVLFVIVAMIEVD